ncbi:MAG: type I polyketide synthase, partial [Myxococcota bacterium]
PSNLTNPAPSELWPLAGQVVSLPDQGALYLIDVGPAVQTYLGDHIVYDTIVVPGAFYLAVLLAIGNHRFGPQNLVLTEVQFHRALTFEHADDRLMLRVQLSAPDTDQRVHAVVSATTSEGLVVHASANMATDTEATVNDSPTDLERLLMRPTGTELVKHLSEMRIDWGPKWRWLSEVCPYDGGLVGRFEAPDGTPNDDAPIAAGLMDASFALTYGQTDFSSLPEDLVPYLPFRIERFTYRAHSGRVAWAFGRPNKTTGSLRTGDLEWFDSQGRGIARAEGFTAHRAPVDRFLPNMSERSLMALTPAAEVATTTDISARYTVDQLAQANDRRAWLDLRGSLGSPTPFARRLLAATQRWLASAQGDESGRAQLTVTTRGAVLTHESVTADPAASAAWGLLRTLRAERPDLLDIRLIDTDSEGEIHTFPAEFGEYIVRDGATKALRLAPMNRTSEPPTFDPQKTVLITGGTGGLGRAIAKHLVQRRGVRRLCLASRRGNDSQGAATVVDELRASGAESVEVVAMDVEDNASVSRVLQQQAPLGAIIHAAGVLGDCPFEDLSASDIDKVFAGKVNGALHLDALTREIDTVDHFVLFSSVSGTLGSPGQANYAAANAALDGIAQRRQAAGYPGVSIAWGPWADVGMAAALSEPLKRRLQRLGLRPCELDEGLAWFDSAIALNHPMVVASHLPIQASVVQNIPLLSPPTSGIRLSTQEASTSLIEDLTALNSEARARRVLLLVRTAIAEVLGLGGPREVPADAPIQDLGLDSLMALELKNRLTRQIDVQLPDTLLFDYPTPSAVTQLLLSKLNVVPEQQHWNEADVRTKLNRVSIEHLRQSGLLAQLMAQPDAPSSSDERLTDLDGAHKDSLFDLAESILREST